MRCFIGIKLPSTSIDNNYCNKSILNKTSEKYLSRKSRYFYTNVWSKMFSDSSEVHILEKS